MSTTTTESVRSQVERAAGTYARSYPALVSGVVDAIQHDGSVQAGKDFLGRQGYGRYAYLLDSVTLPVVDGQATEPVEGFDKATACEVIRAFLLEEGRHLTNAGEVGFQESEITALLQIAGLEDEPEPEPEVTESTEAVDPSLFQRLVAFARSHGFSG